MKKRIPSFLGGFASAVLTLSLAATALAASGQVSFNFANVALDGETRISAGSTITAANGQQVPGSILYTDAAGGKTNYLPIRAISDLLDVEIGYDSATRTVLLGKQPDAAASPMTHWKKVVEGNTVRYESEASDAVYDAAPAWRPAWKEEGWGLASLTTDWKGVRYAMWRYLGGEASVSLTCSNPTGGSRGYMPGGDTVQNCRQVTVRGCQADLYVNADPALGVDDALLVWEDSDGVLFWLRGGGVDADTLLEMAESLQPCPEAEGTYALSGLPAGYIQFERSAAGDTVNETWMKDGMALTWLYTGGEVAVPEGEPETVTVNGAGAWYWAAREPYEEEGAMTVNGEPVEGNSATTAGGVSITSGTVPGVRSGDVNTLVWSSGGVNFRLQGYLDKEALIRAAESVAQS